VAIERAELEERLTVVEEKQESVKKDLSEVTEDVSRVKGRTENFGEQFAALREGQSNLSSRIDHVDQKIDRFWESATEKIDTLRSNTDKKIDTLHRSMDNKIDTLRSDMNKKFNSVDERFDRVDERFDNIQDTMIANFRVTAAIGISILVMMVGSLLAVLLT